MPQKRKICVISGTRADYGIQKPLIQKILKSRSAELQLIVTGMHLQKEFGETVKEIILDKIPISAKVYLKTSRKTGKMAQEVGEEIIEFNKIFLRLKPDIVLVLGDRGEMLAGAIAANYLNIPVAHIHGGELSGHVDGVVRHAITKLSHLHFAATKLAQERIINMSEEKWRVYNFGAPGLDGILNQKLPSKDIIYEKYQLDQKSPFILMVQHPVLSEAKDSARQIKETLEALRTFNLPIIIIYPNSDEGHKEIIKTIEQIKNNKVKVYKSIPHEDYLSLLKNTAVLVGNSSSGIIEAASFKTPVINIGSRQTGRECGANVIHVPYEQKRIAQEIKKILNKDEGYFRKLRILKNPYGDGRASERIVKVLETIDLEKIKTK